MSISGRLEDIGVAGVMQFIHLGERSGILHVESETKVEIHFSKGQIVAVRGSETQRLGGLLVGKGLIDLEALLAALDSQRTEGQGRPLGEVLLSMGVLSAEELSRAVEEHVQATILSVLTWKEGTFRFALSEMKPIQDFERAPDDLLPGVEMSTQMVLLEAARILDHRNRDDPGPKGRADDLPTNTATLREEVLPERAAGSVGAEIDEVMTRLRGDDSAKLKPQLEVQGTSHGEAILDRLRRLSEEIRRGALSANVTLVLLNTLSECTERAVLFLVKQDCLSPAGGFGFSLGDSSRPVAEATRGLHLPLAGQSALLGALIDRRPCRVDLDNDRQLASLLDRIGRPVSGQAALFPVVGIERVLLMIYVDNGAEDREVEHLDLLTLAADQVGIAIENEFLRQRLAARTEPA